MAEFATPVGLAFNRGPIPDPAAFAHDAEAASWLYLCGEDFASMEGGMSFADVQAAVSESVNIVADAPFCKSDQLKAWVTTGLEMLS